MYHEVYKKYFKKIVGIIQRGQTVTVSLSSVQTGAAPEFFHRSGHIGPAKNIGVAYQKQNFSFITLLSNTGYVWKNVVKERERKELYA